jgi:TRAP-type C4-dicarboxylate transport system permease small subunit
MHTQQVKNRGGKMWYYALNNQPAGPVSGEAIQSLLQAGTINLDTLVWQEGMADWKKLGETSLAIPVTPPQAYQTAVEIAQPPAAPSYSPVAQSTPPPFVPQVTASSLKSIFTWCLILLIIANLGSVISNFAGTSEATSVLACAISLFSIAGGILLFVFVYKLWKMIQDGYASTTPGKAIGFLFIPFFNYYWIFRAVFGLSTDMNAFINRHFPAMTQPPIRKTKPVLALVYCIFFIINIFFSVYIYTSTLSSYSGGYSTSSAGLSTVSALFTLAYAVLVILVLSDLYQSAKDILERINR